MVQWKPPQPGWYCLNLDGAFTPLSSTGSAGGILRDNRGLTGFTALEEYFDVVGRILEGKPVWVVRTRNWKLRGGENRLSGLLEGVSVSGNVFTWLSSVVVGFALCVGLNFLIDVDVVVIVVIMIHAYELYGIGKRNEILALRGAFLKPCNGLERSIPQALLRP
ncbi:hypothetical protein GQ457_10G011790 [Hibiscus cannabinus]